MPESTHVYRLVERRGPAGRLVLRQEGCGEARIIVCAGYEGPDLPADVTDPVIDGGAAGRWQLRCAEGAYEFRARAVERIEERPTLLETMHRPFALSTSDRLAVRLLLALLRLPGGARLLRLWHARRV